jgi:hypothetical protein
MDKTNCARAPTATACCAHLAASRQLADPAPVRGAVRGARRSVSRAAAVAIRPYLWLLAAARACACVVRS